jgi:hypothetical protein
MGSEMFGTDEALVGLDPETMDFGERMVKFDYDLHPLWRDEDEDQELASMRVHLRQWQYQALS